MSEQSPPLFDADDVAGRALELVAKGKLNAGELVRHCDMQIAKCKARGSHTGLCCRTLEAMIHELERRGT